jgi:hypothetical protein
LSIAIFPHKVDPRLPTNMHYISRHGCLYI